MEEIARMHSRIGSLKREVMEISQFVKGHTGAGEVEIVKTILDQIDKILDIHSAIVDTTLPRKVVTNTYDFLDPLEDDNMTPPDTTVGKP